MSFVSQKFGQFKYFDLQLGRPDWHGLRVLDFGGNCGNILRDPDCTIAHSRYWCLDVSKDGLEAGWRDFPQAHWVHYDRFNFAFNPNGLPGLPLPDLGGEFDIITSYSVFTHTTRDEMLELVAELRGLLAPGGRLAFTFIDHNHHSWPQSYRGNNLKWRLDKIHAENPSLDVEGLLEKAGRSPWCLLVNDRDLVVNSNGLSSYQEKSSLHTFYRAGYMSELFPDASVNPPANAEMQHCCVIQKPSSQSNP